MDLRERLEVLDAVRHNLEQRLLSICPGVEMESQAIAWERQADELLLRAARLRQRLNEDRTNAVELLQQLKQAEREADLITVCLRHGIKDYSVVSSLLRKV